MKTNLKRYGLVILLLLAGVSIVQAESERIYEARVNKDILSLVGFGTTGNAEERQECIDALTLMPASDFNKLTYEQVYQITLCTKEDKDSLFANFFNSILASRERSVMDEVLKMNPDGILNYLKKYPLRKKLVYDVLGASIVAQEHNLDVRELLFFQGKFPDLQAEELSKEIDNRTPEIHNLIKTNVTTYLKEEEKQTNLFLYVLEWKSYAYIFMEIEKTCREYASIGDVPNTVGEIESQFRDIYQRHFSSSDLHNYLQMEANAYCDVINSTRINYCKAAGIKSYLPMKITVPTSNFTYYSDTELLAKIPAAREEYQEDRKTVGTVSTVAGFFLSPLTTLVGKGILDYLVGDNLADKIVSARIQYIEKAMKSVQRRMGDDLQCSVADIRLQVQNNEKKFESFVESK